MDNYFILSCERKTLTTIEKVRFITIAEDPGVLGDKLLALSSCGYENISVSLARRSAFYVLDDDYQEES